jgi:uncharacterized Zn-binding protein involved in type VI secretion
MSASVFAAADAIVFATFGVAATYRAAGTGTPTAVTVIRQMPTVDAAGFGVAVRAGSQILAVRVADIAEVAKGDTFAIGAETLTVQGAPALDGQGTMWMAEC